MPFPDDPHRRPPLPAPAETGPGAPARAAELLLVELSRRVADAERRLEAALGERHRLERTLRQRDEAVAALLERVHRAEAQRDAARRRLGRTESGLSAPGERLADAEVASLARALAVRPPRAMAWRVTARSGARAARGRHARGPGEPDPQPRLELPRGATDAGSPAASRIADPALAQGALPRGFPFPVADPVPADGARSRSADPRAAARPAAEPTPTDGARLPGPPPLVAAPRPAPGPGPSPPRTARATPGTDPRPAAARALPAAAAGGWVGPALLRLAEHDLDAAGHLLLHLLPFQRRAVAAYVPLEVAAPGVGRFSTGRGPGPTVRLELTLADAGEVLAVPRRGHRGRAGLARPVRRQLRALAGLGLTFADLAAAGITPEPELLLALLAAGLPADRTRGLHAAVGFAPAGALAPPLLVIEDGTARFGPARPADARRPQTIVPNDPAEALDVLLGRTPGPANDRGGLAAIVALVRRLDGRAA